MMARSVALSSAGGIGSGDDTAVGFYGDDRTHPRQRACGGDRRAGDGWQVAADGALRKSYKLADFAAWGWRWPTASPTVAEAADHHPWTC